jgi:hypothetical protein
MQTQLREPERRDRTRRLPVAEAGRGAAARGCTSTYECGPAGAVQGAGIGDAVRWPERLAPPGLGADRARWGKAPDEGAGGQIVPLWISGIGTSLIEGHEARLRVGPARARGDGGGGETCYVAGAELTM